MRQITMITLNEWIELLTIILIWGCIISWVIIWIKMWICRKTGKCPKDRICKNSICKNRAWCRKYQRYADIYKYAGEMLREKRQRARDK